MVRVEVTKDEGSVAVRIYSIEIDTYYCKNSFGMYILEMISVVFPNSVSMVVQVGIR